MNFSKAAKCKGCDVEFTPKRGVRYCTSECCETSKRIESHYGINKAEKMPRKGFEY